MQVGLKMPQLNRLTKDWMLTKQKKTKELTNERTNKHDGSQYLLTEIAMINIGLYAHMKTKCTIISRKICNQACPVLSSSQSIKFTATASNARFWKEI